MAAVSLVGYKNARHPSSNPGYLSTAKSTLTGGLYIPGRDKRLVFASEWVFKPEGIRAVKMRFQGALKENGLIADHEWDSQDMVFRVRCIVGDTPKVSAIFSGILTGIIREAHGDDYLSDEDEDAEIMVTNSDGEDVIFESDKIERISAWNKKHRVIEQNVQSQSSSSPVEVPLQKVLLQDLNHKPDSSEAELIWTCDDDNLRLDDIASDDVLAILKDLTGCEFAKDLGQGKLFIRNSSMESCQRALKKLNNLRQYSEPMSPYVSHVFYAEGIENFQLRPCRFIEVKKRFFKTTFLDPYTVGLLMRYPKLSRAVTIRCASWNRLNSTYTPDVIKKIIPATDPLNTISNSKDLLGFEYCSKGKIENHPLRYLIEEDEHKGPGVKTQSKNLPDVDPGSLEKTKNDRIEGWAQDIFGEILVDGVQNREVVGSGSNLPRLQSSAAKDLEGLNLTGSSDSQVDPFKSDFSFRTQLNSNTTESLLDEDMPGMIFDLLIPLRLSSAPSLSPSWGPSEPCLSASGIHRDTASQISGGSLEASPSQRKPLAATEEKIPNIHQQNPCIDIDSKFTPKDKSPSKSSSTCPSSFVFPAIRKPPKISDQPQIQDPTSEFLGNLKNGFVKLMTGLQGFPGEVIVQAEFGRIILKKFNPKFVTSNDNTASFSQREVLSQLVPSTETSGSATQTFFTKILTTMSTDVGYLLDLKAQTDNAMWEQTAAESSLIYEISCHNEALAGWNPFTIEINGKTFDTQVKTRFDFGALNVHGILRHWDFRVVAFGFGDDEENERLYGDFARAIQCSLYIPSGLSRPCLYFELDNEFFATSKLVIDSISVHQIEKYHSTDKDANSTLKISKVMALDVDSMCPFQGASFQIYKAELPPPECHQEPGTLNMWYEANISSVKCDEELKQNTTMELGDEAGWTPKKLDELGVVTALCFPACEMLKQMDGVGINNDNGVEVQDNWANEPSPPKPYVFW